jgi:predicted nucleic acid-binding protein
VAEINQAIQAGWIIQVSVKDMVLVQALALDLDRGEAEAIALALERKSSYLLIDESDGRAKARAMGLNPVGVIGVLLRAKKYESN